MKGYMWSSSIISSKGAISDQRSVILLGESIMERFFPSYYTSDKLSAQELDMVVKSWEAIELGSSETYLEDICNPSCAASMYSSCLEYFTDLYMDGVIEASAPLRTYFAKHTDKKQWISSFISSGLVQSVHDAEKFCDNVQNWLLSFINEKLELSDISVLGEMIFFALGQVLRDEYTYELHMAWLKLCSWMIRLMTPVYVFSMLNKEDSIERIPKYADWSQCIQSRRTGTKLKSFFKNLSKWNSATIHCINEADSMISDS